MTQPLLIYHGNCFDGFTAAYLFHQGWGAADFYGAKYGEAPPDVRDRDVWIVDFSYPLEVMLQLAADCRTLRVYDHHKTAQAALNDLPGVMGARGLGNKLHGFVFDMERSGAKLMYDELMQWPDVLVNNRLLHTTWLVDYVQDRDLWRQALPDTEAVSAWVAAQPMTFEAWDALACGGRDRAVASGEAVRSYIEQYGRKARAEARLERIAEYVVPTMNLPYMNCSEHVGKLLEENGAAPFAAGYFRRSDGRWQFSLRSRSDFDVSEVAAKFGGGGHRGAAGFDVAALPWMQP